METICRCLPLISLRYRRARSAISSDSSVSETVTRSSSPTRQDSENCRASSTASKTVSTALDAPS
jgi:hypothetical protein